METVETASIKQKSQGLIFNTHKQKTKTESNSDNNFVFDTNFSPTNLQLNNQTPQKKKIRTNNQMMRLFFKIFLKRIKIRLVKSKLRYKIIGGMFSSFRTVKHRVFAGEPGTIQRRRRKKFREREIRERKRDWIMGECFLFLFLFPLEILSFFLINISVFGFEEGK